MDEEFRRMAEKVRIIEDQMDELNQLKDQINQKIIDAEVSERVRKYAEFYLSDDDHIAAEADNSDYDDYKGYPVQRLLIVLSTILLAVIIALSFSLF